MLRAHGFTRAAAGMTRSKAADDTAAATDAQLLAELVNVECPAVLRTSCALLLSGSSASKGTSLTFRHVNHKQSKYITAGRTQNLNGKNVGKP